MPLTSSLKLSRSSSHLDMILISSLLGSDSQSGSHAMPSEDACLGLLVAREPGLRASKCAGLQVPIEEVTEPALPTWLVHARRSGYTLVGLEQTAESVSLLDFEWPERTVLVLGRCVSLGRTTCL